MSAERRLVYSWRSGDAGNCGYGSPLDTVVGWTLTPAEGGTRLRLVHSGFVTQRNDAALRSMGDAWPQVLRTIGSLSSEPH